jgi:hypothetical protein
MINWPRGKYNGMRIEGIKISLAIHILDFRLTPILHFNFGEPVFIWLCFTVRLYVEYEYRVRNDKQH